MLKLSLDRLFKARGIDKPFSYLTNAGLSDNLATKLKNEKVKAIGLNHIEKLCIALRCTPNDLFDWEADRSMQSDKDHPMHSITRSKRVIDMKDILHSVPMDDIEDIEHYIKDKLKTRESSKE